MNEYAYLLHYGTIAAAVGITSISVGLGQGITSHAALKALNTQPSAYNDIIKAAVIGMALVETTAIIGLCIAIFLLLDTQNAIYTLYTGIGEVGIALAICLSGCVTGVVAALPAQAACRAIARQPFFAHSIFRFMLIAQTLIQTPVLFGFVIALIIQKQVLHVATLDESLRLLASGLSIGLGSIGPTLGLGLFLQSATESLGINRLAFKKIFSFTLISAAIIETPVLFSCIIALMLIMSTAATTTLAGIVLIASALTIGLGTMGPGISLGRVAASAVQQIAKDPDRHALYSKISMVAQGLIDTGAIYALLISFMLFFAH